VDIMRTVLPIIHGCELMKIIFTILIRSRTMGLTRPVFQLAPTMQGQTEQALRSRRRDRDAEGLEGGRV